MYQLVLRIDSRQVIIQAKRVKGPPAGLDEREPTCQLVHAGRCNRLRSTVSHPSSPALEEERGLAGTLHVWQSFPRTKSFLGCFLLAGTGMWSICCDQNGKELESWYVVRC